MCTILFSFILGEDVISSCPTQQMRSCNHEEADTRILVHVKDALAKGARSVLVRTVDTDVVVILVAQFHTLSLPWPGTSFWVAFGMGKHFQLLSINSICEYWVNRNVASISRKRKEICLGGLECIPKCHRGFPLCE